MFVSFSAQKEAFSHYRPFIGLDGYHLKGPFEGLLLMTVTLNANSGVLPLVSCVVDLVKQETW